MSSEQDDYRLVLCTCPDQDTAIAIGERLVEERLAACVNVVPGLTSIYRWQGAIEHESELLLLIKTVSARFEALRDALLRLHPYDVPEIIAVPITAGSADYLSWVTTCTQPHD